MPDSKKRTNDIPLPANDVNEGSFKSMNAFERRQMTRQGAPDAMKGTDVHLPNESGKTDPRILKSLYDYLLRRAVTK